MHTIDTELETLSFVRVAADEWERAYDIQLEAARWLLSRGIDQWKWFMTEKGRAFIRRRTVDHESYIASFPDAADVATLTVQWSDPDIWGERGLDETAVYVHGLAVRRSHAGRKLGHALLNFAESLARQRGRTVLRLDCMASNEALCDYYRSAGFVECGDAIHKGKLAGRLFERRIVELPV